MNRFLSILLIFFIAGVPCKDILLYAYYNLDKDFISSVLCINKDKPETKCEGACFLKKKLKENHNSDQNTLVLLEKNNINWLNIEIQSFDDSESLIAKRDFKSYKAMHSILFRNRVFQPPRQF